MIFYGYLLIPQLFSCTAISQRNYIYNLLTYTEGLSCVLYQELIILYKVDGIHIHT